MMKHDFVSQYLEIVKSLFIDCGLLAKYDILSFEEMGM